MSKQTGNFTDKFKKHKIEDSEVTEIKDSEVTEIQKLQDENANLKDTLLRTLADVENTKKRLNLEKDSMVKYTLSSVIKDLALLLDNFYLSTSNVKQDELDEVKNFKNFYDAININLIDISKFLEKNGVQRIYPINEKFNPQLHDAVSQVKVEGVESGMIIQVLSGGYSLYERVIKPAVVIVSL